jgi:integrase
VLQEKTFGAKVIDMPKQKRFKTDYKGVFYVEGTPADRKADGKPDGKVERIYYIIYRRDGKLIEEKAGKQYKDDMTPARASMIRADRIRKKAPTNQETREQEQAANEAERAVEEAEQNRWTINRLWNEYKASHPGLKGLVTDENRYEKHIKEPFGDREPHELGSLDVDKLRIGLLKKPRKPVVRKAAAALKPGAAKKTSEPLKPGTVKNALELLRRIINFGVKKNLCTGAGFTIEMPKVNNVKTEDLTPDQLADLINAIGQDTNIHAAIFMKMVLFTGMRRGELFKLRWQDVDFERGFIRIVDPKGGPNQMIPLNESARALLMAHGRVGDSPFVFPGRHGGQRVDIKKQVNRIKERAGIPKEFRALHGLRHVYASMLASSGEVDMYTLQKLLTHKSPIMTQRYAHLRDETLRKASNLAGDIINQAMNGKTETAQINKIIPL